VMPSAPWVSPLQDRTGQWAITAVPPPEPPSPLPQTAAPPPDRPPDTRVPGRDADHLGGGGPGVDFAADSRHVAPSLDTVGRIGPHHSPSSYGASPENDKMCATAASGSGSGDMSPLSPAATWQSRPTLDSSSAKRQQSAAIIDEEDELCYETQIQNLVASPRKLSPSFDDTPTHPPDYDDLFSRLSVSESDSSEYVPSYEATLVKATGSKLMSRIGIPTGFIEFIRPVEKDLLLNRVVVIMIQWNNSQLSPGLLLARTSIKAELMVLKEVSLAPYTYRVEKPSVERLQMKFAFEVLGILRDAVCWEYLYYKSASNSEAEQARVDQLIANLVSQDLQNVGRVVKFAKEESGVAIPA